VFFQCIPLFSRAWVEGRFILSLNFSRNAYDDKLYFSLTLIRYLIKRLTNTLKSRSKQIWMSTHEKLVNRNFNIVANHLGELSLVLLAYEIASEQ
jgi:hypothetical protein